MAKALTVEMFLGVLAVFALDGCRAASEKASAEPAPAVAASAAATATALAPAPPADEAPPAPAAADPAASAARSAPIATAVPAAPARKAPAVAPGVEQKRDKDSTQKNGPQAACGAGGCSADMKKGTK